MTTFVDNGMSYFNREVIEAAFDKSVEALNL